MSARVTCLIWACSTVLPSLSFAQVSEIIDITGDGTNSLSTPRFVATDSSGNVYVTGELSQNAFRISPAGVITQIIDGSGDGAGNTLSNPNGIAVDSFGNAYVAGGGSANAFKITPGGVVTQILDSSGDGAGNPFIQGRGVAVDSADNVYVAGRISDNVFKITPAGVITEIIDDTGDGSGNTLDGPRGIAVDGSDNVYVVGEFSDNAFRITPGGTITEIIDSTGDGSNALIDPFDVAVDAAGNAYVTGFFDAFQITPTGGITRIIDGTGDGAGNVLQRAFGIAVDSVGNVFVSGGGSDNVFRISPAGVITEILDATGDAAGNPLDGPNGIAVDAFDRPYVTGAGSRNVFRVGSSADRIFEDTGNGIDNVTGAPSGWTPDAAGIWTIGGTAADIAALPAYAGTQAAADLLATLGAGNRVIAATLTGNQTSTLALPTLAATTPGGLSFDFPFEQAVSEAASTSSATLVFDNFLLEFDDAPGGAELWLSTDAYILKEVGAATDFSVALTASKPGPDGLLGTADDIPFDVVEQPQSVPAPAVVFIATGRVRAHAFFPFDGATPDPTDLPGARSLASIEADAPTVPSLGGPGLFALAGALAAAALWAARRREMRPI